MNKYKSLIAWLVILIVFFAAVFWLKNMPQASSLIWNLSQGGAWLFPLVSVAALIDSINPCAFSVLLLTIAFLFSLGMLRSSIFKIGTAYILGLFLAYLLIGLGLLQALHIFNIPHFMGKLGAVLLIARGLLNLLKEIFPKFPISLATPQPPHPPGSRLAAKPSVPPPLVLGAFVGLGESPSTTGKTRL